MSNIDKGFAVKIMIMNCFLKRSPDRSTYTLTFTFNVAEKKKGERKFN